MTDADRDLKRKRSKAGNDGSRKKRHVSVQDARTISAQTTGKAFGNGGIDTEKFIRAREFEIKALEDSVKRSKQLLNTRAFQHVPRDLRRRTASHNVKRVPKRLQARAAKEMAEDNTPTVNSKTRKKTVSTKARLQKSTAKKVSVKTPTGKFRKRQIHKAWLPTHIFHAKRAHMTPPSQPLWRMAIPLSPSTKCYRPTHRASSLRGAVAWDMSYMSTISLSGSQEGILSVLEGLSIDHGNSERLTRPREKERSLAGSRYMERWYYQDSKAIAPLLLVWQARSDPGPRQLFIRAHPSAFHELWAHLDTLTKVRSVTLNDLRFEIGSIEIMGPASAEILSAVLRPLPSAPAVESETATYSHLENLWDQLPSISNASGLPSKTVIACDVADPRLRANGDRKAVQSTPDQEQKMLHMLAEWPLDNHPNRSRLFDEASRKSVCRQMPSQKAVNRRKATAVPGSAVAPLDTDPNIPILILPGTGATKIQNRQGSWVVLMPWRYVLPIWYCIMYQRISTGGTARFGGLNQNRQTLFEAGVPWFPGDYPSTSAGVVWEAREREIRKAEWEKRPKGKRIEYDKIKLGNGEKGELGDGWACAWERLGNDLVTVRLDMLKGGTPTTCARIYRLPSSDLALRKRWLSLLNREPSKAPTSKRDKGSYILTDAPDHIRRRHLAASLLSGGTEPDNNQHPPVPKAEDLIGFVTTGNFNLSAGLGTGIGSISDSAARLPVEGVGEVEMRRQVHLCIVRNAGEVTGRLASWQVVSSV